MASSIKQLFFLRLTIAECPIKKITIEVNCMAKLFQWGMSLVKGMGDALFHPYKDNEPPKIGFQPFTDKTYKNHKISA